MTGKLFLSHASEDKQDAQALRRALEDSDVPVWEDMLDLLPGDRMSKIEAAVKNSRGFVLLWTRRRASPSGSSARRDGRSRPR